jgi:hypothetical protein
MGKRDLEQIIKVIKKVKEPGEPPSQSSTAFDIFECDLCKGDVEKSKLTQCPYCGRWICKDNCWNKKILACNSCSSIIKLSERREDKSYSESSKKTKIINKKRESSKGFFNKFRRKIINKK